MTNQRQTDFAPVTPGEILAEEFLAGYGLTQAALARALGISPNRIAGIVNNRRRITADTALRLGLYFGTTPEFWQISSGSFGMNRISLTSGSGMASKRGLSRKYVRKPGCAE